MALLLSRTVVNCSDPGHVENGVRQSGLRYPEVFSYGVTVSIHCKRGFYLLGSALLTCQHNGLWDRPIPRCLGMGEQVKVVGLHVFPVVCVSFGIFFIRTCLQKSSHKQVALFFVFWNRHLRIEIA